MYSVTIYQLSIDHICGRSSSRRKLVSLSKTLKKCEFSPQVMSSRLALGTYNGGRLWTEAGTLARVVADGTNTLGGYLGESRLLNVTLLPPFSDNLYRLHCWYSPCLQLHSSLYRSVSVLCMVLFRSAFFFVQV